MNGYDYRDIKYPESDFEDKVFTEDELYDGIAYAFDAGAERMQKKLIDKTCEWLNEHMYCTPVFEHDEDENPVNYVCASCCDSVEEFIKNFRKVMEL